MIFITNCVTIYYAMNNLDQFYSVRNDIVKFSDDYAAAQWIYA